MKKVRFDPKFDSISKKDLSTLRGLKWSEEKIIAFNQYQIEFRNQNTPLESDLDDKFEEMWRIEQPLNAFDDEDFGSNDDEGLKEKLGAQVYGQEE